MKSKTTELGSCQCGAVKVAVETNGLVSYVCHCLDCKKQSASAFAISVPVSMEDTVFAGEIGVYKRSAHSGATTSCYFCVNCGTRIYHQSSNSPDQITLKAGILDCVESLVPVAHLWVKRKADWVQLNELVDMFEKQPDDLKKWRDSILSCT